MKRIVFGLVGAGSLAALVGCGSAGIDEGAPKGDMKPVVSMDPNMTNPAGKFGAAAATKSAAKNSTAPPKDGADAKK